jgi:hypothetical protein
MTRFALLALTGWFVLVGCRDSAATVSGSITMDGQPVAQGAITFVKQDGDLAREGAVIADGRFLAKLQPGEYKIELNSQKSMGTRTQKGFDGKDEVVELTAELFPDKYNAKTSLATKVVPGPNTVNLEAKTK